MAKRRQGAESSINKLLSDTEPLDVAEQDHVVASLEAKQVRPSLSDLHHHHASTWRLPAVSHSHLLVPTEP